MAHFNNTPFFSYDATLDYQDYRAFSLQNIQQILHEEFGCGYNQIFIRNITALHEQNNRNGWLDYQTENGTLRLTMIDGMLTLEENNVFGHPELRNNNYDRNNFQQWNNYFRNYDSNTEETYDGFAYIHYEDEGMDMN